MNRNIILLVFLFNLILIGCKTDSTANFEDLNLIEYGLPVTIQAPTDADIKTMEFGPIKDVSIKKNDVNYFVQIFSSDIRSSDFEKIKMEVKEEVESEPFFNEMIEERTDGFIYHTKMDSTLDSYGFRVLKIQGDYEIRFQQGLLGTFSLDDAKTMYTSVSENY